MVPDIKLRQVTGRQLFCDPQGITKKQNLFFLLLKKEEVK